MLRWTATTAPNTAFVVGRAEQLPFQDASIDLITAAGSLDYVDLGAFFREARRILAPPGALAVYDFSPPKLEPWSTEFMRRYPRARDSARALDPDSLASLAAGFALQWQERFEIGLPLTPEFYERCMLTETNVAYAIANGVPETEIREWCHRTLAPVFKGAPREVLFESYIVWLAPL